MAQLSSSAAVGVADAPPEAEQGEHLELICSSKAFESSATLKNLLRYLFEHREEHLSEYGLATEALHRKADFDPQVDATVRVQISRLRRRLKDFYLGEGSASRLRFSIPLGTHQLVVEEESRAGELAFAKSTPALTAVPEMLPETAVRAVPAMEPAKVSRMRIATVALICAVVALGALCVWQFAKIASLARTLDARTADVARGASMLALPFWQEFSANGKPMQLVIPNPTFFSWPGSGLMARDVTVNSFTDIDKSAELSMVSKRLGKPQLSQHYAVSSDVVASLKLFHAMDAAGFKTDMAISSNASSELFEGANVILVGTPGTLTPFKNQLDRLYFKFDQQGFRIGNPQPRAGELSTYNMTSESFVRNIYPGLIAVLPGVSKDSEILILTGQQTAALVSFLTSTAGNQQLMAARRAAGGGPYFEAVIFSEATSDTVLNNRLMAVRTYQASAFAR